MEKVTIKKETLFPAYAGVIPACVLIVGLGKSFPRLRGGDPLPMKIRFAVSIFSPPTRG